MIGNITFLIFSCVFLKLKIWERMMGFAFDWFNFAYLQVADDSWKCKYPTQLF